MSELMGIFSIPKIPTIVLNKHASDENKNDTYNFHFDVINNKHVSILFKFKFIGLSYTHLQYAINLITLI